MPAPLSHSDDTLTSPLRRYYSCVEIAEREEQCDDDGPASNDEDGPEDLLFDDDGELVDVEAYDPDLECNCKQCRFVRECRIALQKAPPKWDQ